MHEAWSILNEYLKEKFGGRWREILKKAFEVGVEAALSALEAMKDEITRVCKENCTATDQASKIATKAGCQLQICLPRKRPNKRLSKVLKVSLTLSLTWSPKLTAGIAAKKTSKMAAGQIADCKISYQVCHSDPLGVEADLAQAGLEWAGHKEVGKTLGVTGNITAG